MHHITAHERDQIACWHAQGISNGIIATRLHRHVASIGRELTRNGTPQRYHAIAAQHRSVQRNHVSRTRNALKDPHVYTYVVAHLRDGWSPEQIAGRLKRTRNHTVVCHETIYRYIYTTLDGRLQQLQSYLPRHHTKRTQRRGKAWQHARIPERISIHERPMVVNQRKTFGHWELDAMEGARHHQAIATFLERVSRYYQAVKISNLDAEEAIHAHVAVLGMYPPFARKTATFDNGKENTNHTKLRQYYGMETYFCDAYCAWQKGSNEYHNGLLRRYIPKKTDFTPLTQHDLDTMVEEMNTRPRKCLNYATPKEVFMAYLHQREGCDSD